MTHNSNKLQPPRHVLAGILRDAAAISRAGRWHEAEERCMDALVEHAERVRQRSIGAPLMVDLIATDVARLIGADIDLVRAVAREELLERPIHVVAGVLAAIRCDLCSERRGLRR